MMRLVTSPEELHSLGRIHIIQNNSLEVQDNSTLNDITHNIITTSS